jgi:hypothetical protein
MQALTRSEARRVLAECIASPAWFTHHWLSIEDRTSGDWLPFRLWDAQSDAILSLESHNLVLWLKARQLGMTWLALAYTLHTLLFFPGSQVLLFSRRDDEAMDLLVRLKGMYSRLPEWMKTSSDRGDAHEWELSNGSRCLAFPTTAGDSYTATMAVVDEADLVPNLDKLLGSVKPTIDAGGKLLLLSRPDKSRPLSPFKRLARAALQGEGPWHLLFLPWHARPGRTAAWYEDQRADSLTRTGSLDALWEQYPGTPEEALAARTLDKRLPPAWLTKAYRPTKPIEAKGAPLLPGLRLYQEPQPGAKYVIGGDIAEGNPTSDDSGLCVLDARTGEQVAAMDGKFDPAVTAGYADRLGAYFNQAALMIERNNHGHSTLLWLKDNSSLRRLKGHDKNHGWLSSSKGKCLLYDAVADAVRDGEVVVRDAKTYQQLADLEGSTLRAPEGLNDDAADAFALAVVGMPLADRGVWKAESF